MKTRRTQQAERQVRKMHKYCLDENLPTKIPIINFCSEMARQSGEGAEQPPTKKPRKSEKVKNLDVIWNECVQKMKVKVDDPGIAICWADDEILHDCLGVTGPGGAVVAPVPQGADAAASGVAIRNWFSDLVLGVNRNSSAPLGEGIPSFMFFHHLTFPEFTRVKIQLQQRQMRAWATALDAVNLSAGKFVAVSGAGRGKSEAQREPVVPFLW